MLEHEFAACGEVSRDDDYQPVVLSSRMEDTRRGTYFAGLLGNTCPGEKPLQPRAQVALVVGSYCQQASQMARIWVLFR